MVDYKDIKIEHIIDWCIENGQEDWLIAKSEELVDYSVYPRKDSGEKNKKGYPIYVADKSQAPRIEKRKISFIQIKFDWASKFMPEILPEGKEKEPTMYDKIAALKNRKK